MSTGFNLIVLSVVGLLSARAGAGGFPFSNHVAFGGGAAQVADGVNDSDATSGPDDTDMFFLALDETDSGTASASARGSGLSRILSSPDDQLHLQVELVADYAPSPFPGGDNPGGSSDASLTSVIEFSMPTDQLLWSYAVDITAIFPYSGVTVVVVRNITTSTTLLALMSDTPTVDTVLSGSAGDVIRMSATMSGGGQTGPGPFSEYSSELDMLFTIPEPAALTLVLIATPLIRRRRMRL